MRPHWLLKMKHDELRRYFTWLSAFEVDAERMKRHRSIVRRMALVVALLASAQGCSVLDKLGGAAVELVPKGVSYLVCELPPTSGDVIMIAVLKGALCGDGEATELVVSINHKKAHEVARLVVKGDTVLIDGQNRERPVTRVLVDERAELRILMPDCVVEIDSQCDENAETVVRSLDVLAISTPGHTRQLNKMKPYKEPKTRRWFAPWRKG